MAQGDKSKAQKAFEQARIVAERWCVKVPTTPPRRAMLGQVLAALGQKDAAIAEGKRAAGIVTRIRRRLWRAIDQRRPCADLCLDWRT